MRCYRAKRLFSLYIDGALKKEEKEELEAHIKQCAVCKARLEEMLIIHNGFASIEYFKAPEGLTTRIMAHIQERNIKRLSLFPVLTRVVEVGVIILTIIIGSHLGGIIKTALMNSQQGIATTLSLEAFDSVQPHSIGGVYIAMVEGRNEK